MGVRFQGTFKPYIDDGFEEVTVEVVDINGGGSLPIRIERLDVFSESEAREPLAVVRPARCEVTFLIEDDQYKSFIDELAEQVEDRFYIVLSFVGYQYFVGVVVHDFLEYDDISYPFSFTLNAQDGLVRMKDIDFVDDDGNPFNETAQGPYWPAMELIFKCFEKLNLGNIYDTSYDTKRIWVNCDWYATNMANTTDNPLDMLYINTDIFYEYDNDGNLIADKCYDVMETILQDMGLSITYGRGIYRIDQYSSRAPNAAFYWNYNFDGTPSGTRTQSWSKSIDKELVYPKAIGKFSMLPALRQVKVQYEYGLDEVAVEPDEEYGFGASFEGGNPSHKVCFVYPDDHEFLAGQLRELGQFTIPEAQNPLKYRVHFQLMVRTTFSGSPEDWMPHKYIVRIWLALKSWSSGSNPDYAYSRPMFVYGYDNIVPGVEEWLTGGTIIDLGDGDIQQGGYDFVTEPFLSSGSQPTSKYYDIGFETQEFPEDPVEWIRPYLCVGLQEIVTLDGSTLSSDYQIEYSVSDITVIYGESNNRAKPTVETVDYVSSINEGGKDEKTIKSRIGDRGNTMKVWDGSELQASGGWGKGAGGSKELGQMLADEYHAIRGKPIRLMNRTVIGRRNRDIDVLTAFDYCDLYWLSLQTAHDHYTQEITGTWWNHTGNYAPPSGGLSRIRKSYSRYHRLDNPEAVNGAAGRVEARGRDGDGFTAPATKFLIDTENFTLPNKDVYDADAMNKVLDVYINGDKLEYIYTIPASQGNTWYTVDNSDNSIVVSSNFPLSARHWIQVFLNAGGTRV